MIRLPPSAILMAHSDITDYEKRQQATSRDKARQKGLANEQYARIGLSCRGSPDSDRSCKNQVSSRQIDLPTRLAHDEKVPQTTFQEDRLNVEYSPQSRSGKSSSSQDISITELQGDELGYVAVGPEHSLENAAQDTGRPFSPSKDDFYYGGFIETPSQSLRDETFQTPFSRSRNPHRVLAAYEQERTVSSSTEGRSRGSDNVNLYEDLRGSSLQSSRNPSADSTDLTEIHKQLDDEDDPRPIIQEHEEYGRTHFTFSSPQLSLPPPFSTVARSVSRAESLPSSPTRDHMLNPLTSPIRSSSTTPSQAVERGHSLHNQTTAEHFESSPPSGSRFNPVNIMNRALSSFRTRSPFSRQGSPTQRQDQRREVSGDVESISPSRVYRIYNDELSPETQPQTPAHLPESRHQSRYHPSYTAPVTRAAARRGTPINNGDGEGLQSVPRQRHVPFYTPLRGGRSTSPLGLTQSGFEGLYGGRENGDEEQNWVEGVRFNNAETRLWGSRDGQNEGGSLRETPEPDEWRVGRRG
ncbi:hypothetical protein QTJ16_002665 [Diplocarpon rosae]|uniref:Uncharacterized protein n=1 Tax=Diplocarpon rosae TaxID=946125 RepID=A0AAD9T3D8_9HELO|nr:hypothetical protein QTJ16_002665 [Diplocarpon rosae]